MKIKLSAIKKRTLRYLTVTLHRTIEINDRGGFELAGSDLSERDLRPFDLSESNFDQANLQYVILFENNMHGCSMRQTDCRGSLMVKTKFDDSDLTGIDARGAILKLSSFKNCQGMDGLLNLSGFPTMMEKHPELFPEDFPSKSSSSTSQGLTT